MKGETAPTVLELTGAPSGLVTEGPASLDVVFSKPITGLDAADLTLARDGGVNLIDAQVTFAQVGERTYRIGNLARLTAADGSYVLAINAAGVQDGGGNAGLGVTTARWTRDATPPVLLDVIDPATNPRNIVVQQIDVAFSEPIDMASLDGADLRLVRDGGSANLLAGDSRVTIEPRGNNVYRISGINWAQAFVATPQIARFTLTVDAAGVTEQAGNPGAGLLASTWTIDLDKPAPATNLALATDSGPATGGQLNSRRATLSGALSETGLTVVVRDVTTGRELARQKIDGAAFALPIEFPSAGRHALQVRVVDPAGNVADAALDDLFVNETRPTVRRLGGVPAGPTAAVVDAVDVEFVEPIDAASLTGAALSLFRDGGPNLLAVPPTVAPLPGGRTFRFTGLAASAAVDGQYQLRLDLRGVRSALGVAANEVLVGEWLRDAASPNARMTPLPETTPTSNFLVQWSGDDGPRGAGIAAFDVFVAINGGNFAPWTVGTSEREGVFAGSPGVRYAFYAVAVDRAGNRQPAPAGAQTQTVVAAAVNGAPIGMRLSSDAVKPRSPLGATVGVLSTIDPNANDVFTYALVPGPGSGDNASFAINGNQLRTAAPLAAAPREYAVRVRSTDSGGLSYEQSFVIEAATNADFNGDNAFTGRDLLAWQRSFGTPQAASGDGDADGDRDVDADDLAAWGTEFGRPPVPAVLAFDPQHGPRQRSFVRYVDLQWNAGVSSAELAGLAASVDDADAGNDRIRLRQFGLNGARENVVNLQGRVRAVDQVLTLDFGAAGLGGEPSGTAGDGYYELGIDRDGDGDLETRVAFFRLLGDASGDGFVDGADLAIINAALGQFGGNLDADVNGDGRVDGLDEAAWQRGQGRALAPGLRP